MRRPERRQREAIDVSEELKAFQTEKGCLTCFYADQEAVAKGTPCCTHLRGPSPTDGTCANHREKEA